MCKTYGYIRVSTKTQSEDGYGLSMQREALQRFAANNEITLTGIFEDAGISGNLSDDAADDAIEKRAGLMDLLSVIEEGDTVLVMNTSRLWRSDMTKVLVRREIRRRKAKVVSIEQPRYDIYSTDPNDYLINGMMEILDVYERMSISLKLSRGRTTKAKTGNKPAGLCPFGYDYAEDKKTVVIVPEEATIVKRIFTLAQTGKTLTEIVEILNGDGCKTRRGNDFSRGSVYGILNNRFYLGELHHQGTPIPGNHEALISKIQFGKVQKQLEKRHK